MRPCRPRHSPNRGAARAPIITDCNEPIARAEASLANASVSEAAAGWRHPHDTSLMRVLVLGAGGGAGQAVSMHCANADVKHLTLINRSVEKLDPLEDAIAEVYPRGQISTGAWNDASLAKALDHSDLVINCSSLGMKPEDPSPIPAPLIDKRHLLFDTIYVSDRTPLMQAAEKAGARSANGLTMLLYQGEVAFEIWFQRPAPIEVMREVLFAHMRAK